MIRRSVMSLYCISILLIFPVAAISVWYEQLRFPALIIAGFILLPLAMSIVEYILRGNTQLTAWIWTGQRPWPKQESFNK